MLLVNIGKNKKSCLKFWSRFRFRSRHFRFRSHDFRIPIPLVARRPNDVTLSSDWSRAVTWAKYGSLIGYRPKGPPLLLYHLNELLFTNEKYIFASVTPNVNIANAKRIAANNKHKQIITQAKFFISSKTQPYKTKVSSFI